MNEKPNRPVTVIPLALVAVAGLVAQFSSARSAFDLITDNYWHATGAALVIEGATVVEALVFIRSRNGYAALGLTVTMLSSATYNYTQALGADAGLEPVQLIAMSVGPLGALVSVGLAMGGELRKYESALVKWLAVQDELAQEEADLLRRATLKAEREAQEEMRWQRQLEQQRLEGELERQRDLQATQLKEKGLALRRSEKAERKKEAATIDAPATRQGDNGARAAPRWRNKAHFLSDTDRPDDLKPRQLMTMAESDGRPISLRTAQRWLAPVQSDNGRE